MGLSFGRLLGGGQKLLGLVRRQNTKQSHLLGVLQILLR